MNSCSAETFLFFCIGVKTEEKTKNKTVIDKWLHAFLINNEFISEKEKEPIQVKTDS